jgi:thiamine biosynthesis protein ThiI
MNSFIVHYQEIALKGKNRPWFIGRLVRNLRVMTADLGVRAVRPLMGRIEIVLGPDTDPDAVRERVRRTCGVANFAPAGRIRMAALEAGDPIAGAMTSIDAIAAAVLTDLGDIEAGSFRVSAKRGDKRFPLTSPAIEREVGGRIKMARGWRVDLSRPALTIHVELLTDEAFYSFGKERAVGGLPTGSSGRVACLLSGGIDSPVAAFRLMKRGCSVMLVHFHSYPILSRASQDKVREIAALLATYQHRSRLHLVAFGEIQREIVLSAPPPLRVVLYRRLMVRIAERLARHWKARALVTGDVIGQVASQTLDNLATIGSVATMPVLRPLVGMDKDEITAEAQQLGTYPISIIPDQDCCQLFTPPHPATRARLWEVEEAERQLPIERMVDAAAASAVLEEFTFPVVGDNVVSEGLARGGGT